MEIGLFPVHLTGKTIEEIHTPHTETMLGGFMELIMLTSGQDRQEFPRAEFASAR